MSSQRPRHRARMRSPDPVKAGKGTTGAELIRVTGCPQIPSRIERLARGGVVLKSQAIARPGLGRGWSGGTCFDAKPFGTLSRTLDNDRLILKRHIGPGTRERRAARTAYESLDAFILLLIAKVVEPRVSVAGRAGRYTPSSPSCAEPCLRMLERTIQRVSPCL